jgi:hypothetical protein
LPERPILPIFIPHLYVTVTKRSGEHEGEWECPGRPEERQSVRSSTNVLIGIFLALSQSLQAIPYIEMFEREKHY